MLPGHWKVTLDETPVTIASEVLAENVPLTYGGEELTAERADELIASPEQEDRLRALLAGIGPEFDRDGRAQRRQLEDGVHDCVRQGKGGRASEGAVSRSGR